MDKPAVTVTLFPPAPEAAPHQTAWGQRSLITVDPLVARLISCEAALEMQSLPIARHGPVVTVAMVDPDDFETLGILTRLLGLRVRAVAILEEELLKVLPRVYNNGCAAAGLS